MKKRFLSMLLAVLMVLTLLPTAAFADGELSGKCGENVTWKLKGDTLTISGTGPMDNYRTSPWMAYSDRLTRIVVEEGITGIGANSFAPLNMGGNLIGALSNVSSVSLPQSLKSIGDGAFSFCSGLESIVLPAAVESIGISAFKGCAALIEISIPNSVNNIGVGAFEQCSSLKSVVVPTGVLSISEWTFSLCEQLESVELPENLTEIGGNAFKGCKALRAIALPARLKSIGSEAFSDCSSLLSVTLPDGLTAIGYHAFFKCEKLAEVKIPSGLTQIGGGVFADCGSLESIEIPSDWTSLRGIYNGCTGIKEMVVPDGFVELVSGEFYGCTNLKSVVLPDSIKAIGKKAFGCCSSLESIIIPEGVMTIGEYSFEACISLTEIYLPKSMKTIDVCSMNGCEALESIYYGGSLRQWKEGVAFTGEYPSDYDSAKDGLVNAQLYFLDGSDPFTDIDIDWCHDEICLAYMLNIVNGTSETTFSPNDSVTREQYLTMLWRMVASPMSQDELSFADSAKISAYAKAAVAWAVRTGIVKGYPDNTFRPGSKISRAEMATMTYRFITSIEGIRLDDGLKADFGFKDVAANQYYAEAVNVMANLEIIKGMTATTFAPNDTATRAQAAVIMMRTLAALLT